MKRTDIFLLGLSHKTAPIEIRECLAISSSALRSALTHFDTTHAYGHITGVREGVILSTCNRLEIYTLIDDPGAQEELVEFLSQSTNTEPNLFQQHLYTRFNEEAVEHLFKVASGLDSMVLGEPQILGQITDAYEAALSQDAAKTVMSSLFRAAIHTGKRVRTETAISVNPSSISSVAARLAQQLLGDLSQKQVLLIGAGDMGKIAVRALVQRGVTNITVANRTYENARALAQIWGGQGINFQQLPEAMAIADVIITSTGAPHTILTPEHIESAMQSRPDRPLFLIDIAVPRDIDPDVTQIPNVYLHDIDDLQQSVDDNIRKRKSEIPSVEQIVFEEKIAFLEWLASLDVVSTITDLRQRVEELRLMELERLFNRLNLDDRSQELIATMSHRLINKILHRPIMGLRQKATNGDSAAYISTVRDLFSLNEPSPFANRHQPHKNGKVKSYPP